jgi:hypothetical protein
MHVVAMDEVGWVGRGMGKGGFRGDLVEIT